MALGDPIQWIVIGVIVIAIFLWGPQKIPDIAKAIGRARREYDQASKETASPPPPQLQTPSQTGDDVLIETARKLGIDTTGLTREQISAEILRRSLSKS